ncbi:MAG: hypothetical protein Q9168_006128 [Polycauliona sp. 1 TL-2023]
MSSQPQIRVVRSSESLKGFPYNDTGPAQPPVPFLTPPRSSRLKTIVGFGKPRLSPRTKCLPHSTHPERRDSGLAPSSSTTRNSRTTINTGDTDLDSNRSLGHSPSLPQLSTPDRNGDHPSPTLQRWDRPQQRPSDTPPVLSMPFTGLVTEIPNGSLDDLSQPDQIEFSNRGSMLLGGRKVNPANGSQSNGLLARRKPSVHLSPPTPVAPKRVLSPDEQISSDKVRLMYEDGIDHASSSTTGSRLEVDHEDANSSSTNVSRNASTSPARHDPIEITIGQGERSRSPTSTARKPSLPSREAKELAGGMEDWDSVSNGDVDRYGFIVPRKASRDSSIKSGKPRSPQLPRLQRVSTALQIASDTPRKYRGRPGQDRPPKSPARSPSAFSSRRPSSRNDRPPSSQSSLRGTLGGTQSKIRSTTNKLPHRRHHRYLEEAGDMLTLPPGLADIDENHEDSRAAEDTRRREREREEKWRKMARVVNNDDKRGGGMVFDFDTKSPKLLERTWKGIPDRWRATAWHAFLTSSAEKRGGLPSDSDLKAAFHKLLEQGSPDDVQIDIDVPRTINSHIMFRRRYRGGQRLLFRVLHCLSIYFPDTGYVQGMAALAATLLCYFDEEMTFVMLVRLWQLRGLERLYQSGFEGLMQALEEFETGWLANGEVSQKLKVLDIFPTAYGTRWYLTLFNYSIPFPAQLRVWDVFMLLGDPDEKTLTSISRKPIPAANGDVDAARDTSYHGGLDVLHAVSAALIDGTREILLDSDFENAMKVLTSWIPIRDEELLMRVAKAEWKMHRRKK